MMTSVVVIPQRPPGWVTGATRGSASLVSHPGSPPDSAASLLSGLGRS